MKSCGRIESGQDGLRGCALLLIETVVDAAVMNKEINKDERNKIDLLGNLHQYDPVTCNTSATHWHKYSPKTVFILLHFDLRCFGRSVGRGCGYL